MNKDGKEITHVKVGEEKWTYIIIIYKKIKYKVCHNKNGQLKRNKSTYKPHYTPQTYTHSP